MKTICLILFFLSTNFSCKSSIPNNDNVKKIIIEWKGDSDKPIKSIQICITCKNDFVQNHFKISETTFNNIVSVFELDLKNESVIKVSIDENNRNIQKPKLNNVLEILKKTKENENLIDELEIFIKRIG